MIGIVVCDAQRSIETLEHFGEIAQADVRVGHDQQGVTLQTVARRRVLNGRTCVADGFEVVSEHLVGSREIQVGLGTELIVVRLVGDVDLLNGVDEVVLVAATIARGHGEIAESGESQTIVFHLLQGDGPFLDGGIVVLLVVHLETFVDLPTSDTLTHDREDVTSLSAVGEQRSSMSLQIKFGVMIDRRREKEEKENNERETDSMSVSSVFRWERKQ